MFGEGYKKNPFKSAERFYPVEMPYTMDETFILSMDVPAGYVVDELPKQMLAKYDEQGQSFFEYRIQQSGNTISMRSRIKINRAFFNSEAWMAATGYLFWADEQILMTIEMVSRIFFITLLFSF